MEMAIKNEEHEELNTKIASAVLNKLILKMIKFCIGIYVAIGITKM